MRQIPTDIMRRSSQSTIDLHDHDTKIQKGRSDIEKIHSKDDYVSDAEKNISKNTNGICEKELDTYLSTSFVRSMEKSHCDKNSRTSFSV